MLQKIISFMMSKKVLPIVAIVLLGGILWGFRSSGKTPGNDDKTKQQQLLVTVGAILERRHYDPKKIDDAFSKQIFKKYLNGLDQQHRQPDASSCG
jgi:carboxyl-terminal processing protease